MIGNNDTYLKKYQDLKFEYNATFLHDSGNAFSFVFYYITNKKLSHYDNNVTSNRRSKSNSFVI